MKTIFNTLIVIIFHIFFGNTYSALAGEKIIVMNGSSQYSAIIAVGDCQDKHCDGKGTIQLFDKKNGKAVQTFTSEELIFDLNDNHQAIINDIDLLNLESPLIFDDLILTAHRILLLEMVMTVVMAVHHMISTFLIL